MIFKSKWYNSSSWESLNKHEAFILFYLCSLSGKYMTSWPSTKTISKICKTNKNVVIRSLKSLEYNGFIIKNRRFSKTSVYTININKLEETDSIKQGTTVKKEKFINSTYYRNTNSTYNNTTVVPTQVPQKYLLSESNISINKSINISKENNIKKEPLDYISNIDNEDDRIKFMNIYNLNFEDKIKLFNKYINIDYSKFLLISKYGNLEKVQELY